MQGQHSKEEQGTWLHPVILGRLEISVSSEYFVNDREQITIKKKSLRGIKQFQLLSL